MGSRIEMDGEVADILVVEDNPGDARLFEEHLAEAGLTNPVHHVATAEQALEFVARRGQFADAPAPDLLFLDWHLPKGTGAEVLEGLPDESEPGCVFTVVLTGSMRDPASVVPQGLGVDGYLTKPIDTDELLALVESSEVLSVARAERNPGRDGE